MSSTDEFCETGETSRWSLRIPTYIQKVSFVFVFGLFQAVVFSEEEISVSASLGGRHDPAEALEGCAWQPVLVHFPRDQRWRLVFAVPHVCAHFFKDTALTSLLSSRLELTMVCAATPVCCCSSCCFDRSRKSALKDGGEAYSRGSGFDFFVIFFFR